ncbi:SDR family oxidoreductase [Edaphobacter paludis]|uniref:Peroxisomal trans-2-enoyl-CoA reductase n=1 Tax=Edaphobacter paludis TaxID=3035702 RepID=A0AAU7CUJ9_9BACT
MAVSLSELAIPDEKTGELVDFLFMYRGRPIGKCIINHTIIPTLCKKAGVPEKDTRGSITSHRARSTIASQLYNAKQPMSLFALKEWLGHRRLESTQWYAKVTPDKHSMVAYIISKRANHLRVQASSISWGKRGARVNSISPGIILTPLALHELSSPIGDMYRTMIEASPAKRMASPDEIAVAANFLLGPDAGFVTGSDLLIDGGVISAMLAGLLPTP